MEDRASVQLHIALFGELPETADWLRRQEDLVLHFFADSVEIERAIDTLEVCCDLVLIRVPGVTEILSATLSTCCCPALLLDDPPSDAALRRLEDWITAERYRPGGHRWKPRSPRIDLGLRPDAVYSEEDGVPTLTRGELRRKAADAAQAWLLRLIKDGAKPLDGVLEQMERQGVVQLEPDESLPSLSKQEARQLSNVAARCVIAKFALNFCDFLTD